MLELFKLFSCLFFFVCTGYLREYHVLSRSFPTRRSADQIEGGLGGLINIHTARPFDFDGFHVALTGSATYSEFQDKAGPRISGIVSNRWQTGIGEIGVLLGAQFERYSSGGYQVSTNSFADNSEERRVGKKWVSTC